MAKRGAVAGRAPWSEHQGASLPPGRRAVDMAIRLPLLVVATYGPSRPRSMLERRELKETNGGAVRSAAPAGEAGLAALLRPMRPVSTPSIMNMSLLSATSGPVALL